MTEIDDDKLGNQRKRCYTNNTKWEETFDQDTWQLQKYH